MKHLKKYKLFESQEDLVSDVRDILADVSERERVGLTIDDNSIIIGIGDDDKLFSTNTTDLIDLTEYVEDLQHLDSYLESKGFKLKDAAIWNKSISHSHYDKWMKYNFDSVIEWIKRFETIYIDIMYEK